MKLNEHIARLRAEGSGPEAKARTIARLQESKEHKTMKLIGKVGIPAALVASLAIVGALSIPRTALASPATVAKAIRGIGSYVINSFVMMDGKRRLSSKTTVVDGKSTREFFDNNGKPMSEGVASDLDGVLLDLVIGYGKKGKNAGPTDLKGGDPTKEVVLKGLPMGADGKKVEIKMTKGADGQVSKHYFVDGKEVKELPADLRDHVRIGSAEIRDRTRDGKDKQIELSGQGEKPEVHGGMMVIDGGKNGAVSHFMSGETSVDYLLKLLDDTSRWNISRNVIFNGQHLDKFTLTGPKSPIELFVDPQTSLPKVLRFVGAGDGTAPEIEDEYQYGANPPK